MSANKKARAKGQQIKGKAKEAAGRATGKDRLTAEGRAEQAKGDAREAVEKAKDTFRR
ncbi:CsbD family protein [Streptomyces sp. URMC 123]|uniref:CsbD family protein n=1 Tax=Streptomyces sp. URMC 123 TaxID=3423403 RepID=UPI003F1A5DBF